MKKVILAFIAVVGFSTASQAQLLKIGIKAGPNFSNFSGGISDINYKSRTSLHAGLVAELKLLENFSIQPELLYSSQGAKVDGLGDFNLDYVALPIMGKFYLMTDKLSLEAGPQFSFLINDPQKAYDNQDFDFAVAGGLGLNLTKSIFVSARYVVGLSEVSKYAEVKNSTFQLSAGFLF
ncbi:porin family protein [Flavobacterium ardleyense]|uniref:porin family protein n=1 Tax=Flavobacterium ardleyense TaxID=2038737 RepID=UPI00298C932C|nr:porin family protein [Flavobacterium ardleyense]